MIKITDNIWIGNSDDEKKVIDYRRRGSVDGVLIVAQDMEPTNGWDGGVEYMHVGLVDGPGNMLATYHAAVLALMSLARRGKVLVCCHDGGRSLAVAVMYLYLTGDGPSWDECIDRMADTHRNEFGLVCVPTPHDAHSRAFSLMDWGMLARVLDGEV